MRAPLPALLPFLVLPLSCGEIGAQPPETDGVMISSDGSTIVRLYNVLHVTSYSRRGGSVTRSGYAEHFIEVYEGASGRLRTTTPYEIDGNCDLVAVTTDRAWIRVMNEETREFELRSISLADGSVALDAEALARRNNGLVFQPNSHYHNSDGYEGQIVQADDARIYAIDAATGMATPIPDTIRMVHAGHGQWDRINHFGLNGHVFGFEGEHRKRLVCEKERINGIAEKVTSTIDFIEPGMIGKFQGATKDMEPITYQNGPFILSKTKAGNRFAWRIDLMDTRTLDSKWSVELDLTRPDGRDNEIMDLALNEHRLTILAKNFIGALDARTGAWVWQHNFVSTE